MSPRAAHRRDRLPRHGGARAAARARPTATSSRSCARPTRGRRGALDGVLRHALARPGAARGRVRAVAGDLTRPGSGCRRERAALAEDRRRLHCAASVSFDLPLERRGAINVEGTRAGARPRARGARALDALRPRLDRVRRGPPRGPSASDSSTPARRSATPTSRPSSRPSSSSPSARPRAGVVRPSIVVGEPARLDAVVQRPLLAAARVRPRALRRGAGASRTGASTSCRSTTSPTRSSTLLDRPDAAATLNLVAGARRRRPSTSSSSSASARSAARARRSSSRARSARRAADETAPSTCRTSTWRSSSTTPARARCSGPRASAAAAGDYFATLVDFAERARWGKRELPREEAREQDDLPAAA